MKLTLDFEFINDAVIREAVRRGFLKDGDQVGINIVFENGTVSVEVSDKLVEGRPVRNIQC